VSSRERTKGNTLIEDRDEEKGEREREKGNKGAAQLTNRSIVGGKTICSLTARPDSSPLFFLDSNSLSLPFCPSFSFDSLACAFKQPVRSLIGRGKRESALPFSNLSPVQKNWPTSSWVIYMKRKSYCTTKKGRCPKKILFLEFADVSFRRLRINRERRNNISI